MKKVGEVITKTQAENYQPSNGSSRPHGIKPEHTRVMWDLWAALASAYGSAFVTQFGEEPSIAWIDGLAGYSPEAIKRGFDATLQGGSDYAPNLAAIIRMIEETRPSAAHKPFNPDIAITDTGRKKRTDAAAQSALAEMRAVIMI